LDLAGAAARLPRTPARAWRIHLARHPLGAGPANARWLLEEDDRLRQGGYQLRLLPLRKLPREAGGRSGGRPWRAGDAPRRPGLPAFPVRLRLRPTFQRRRADAGYRLRSQVVARRGEVVPLRAHPAHPRGAVEAEGRLRVDVQEP